MKKKSHLKLFTILLILLLVMYVVYKVYTVYKIYRINTSESYKNLTFLNLVLFSPDQHYNNMYEITSPFYRKFSNVDTIYYLHDENINSEYIYDPSTNILRIRGKETYLPGILEKTVKAFKYAGKMDKKYDYYVRSNISTIIDFDRLSSELSKHPVDYGSGRTMTISKGWKDEMGGIRDDRYEGVPYASGTSIIISNELFMKMLENIDLIDYNVIDDVAIGDFIKRYYPQYPLKGFDSLFVSTEGVLPENLNKICKHYVFFRNRHPNREDDVKKMREIVSLL